MKKVVLTLAALSVPGAALACPVCFGESSAPMALATNTGVLAMLGVVVGVLACFATFFLHLMRRAKMVAKTQETV